MSLTADPPAKIRLTSAQRRCWWIIAAGFFAAHFISYTFQVTAPAFFMLLDFTWEQYGSMDNYFYWGLTLGALLSSPLCSRFGSKKTWLLSTALFSLSATLCALASSAQFILTLRFLTGVGIMSMTIAALIILSALLPAARRGWYIAMALAFGTLATPIGPLLVDLLFRFTGSGGWRFCFAAMALSLLLLPFGWRGLIEPLAETSKGQAPSLRQRFLLLILLACALYQLTAGGSAVLLNAGHSFALIVGLSFLVSSTVAYGLMAFATDRFSPRTLLLFTAGLAGALSLLRFFLPSPDPINNAIPLAATLLSMVLPLAAYGFAAICWIYAACTLQEAGQSHAFGLLTAAAFMLVWLLRTLLLRTLLLPFLLLGTILFFASAVLVFCWIKPDAL